MTITVTHTFQSAVTDDVTASAAGEVLPSHWNAHHTVTGGTPGGSDTQLQYNNAGAFGGIPALTTNGVNVTFQTVTGNASGSEFIIDGSTQAGGTGATTLVVQNKGQLSVQGNSVVSIDSTSSFTVGATHEVDNSVQSVGSQQGVLAYLTAGNDPTSADGGSLQTVEFQNSYTANHTVPHEEFDVSYDNTGAAGEVDFTLIDPTQWAKGLSYSFCVTAAQTVKIIATGGAKIYRGGTATAANGNISSNTPGSCIELISRDFGAGMGYSGTDWVAKSITGTWA